MESNKLHRIGVKVFKNSKQGGGAYTVIGHINCQRCEMVIEVKEIITPTKQQIKNQSYYGEYAICPVPAEGGCGLFQPNKETHVNLKEVKITIE